MLDKGRDFILESVGLWALSLPCSKRSGSSCFFSSLLLWRWSHASWSDAEPTLEDMVDTSESWNEEERCYVANEMEA